LGVCASFRKCRDTAAAKRPFGIGDRSKKRRCAMKKKGISRREFLKDSSLLGAGAFLAAAGAKTSEGMELKLDPSKAVNYNPKMKYRRLGKTGLMLSEISLGGHWRNRGGGRYWDRFADDECPADVAKNRTDVVSKCIECGINYLDITTRAECISYGIAIKGRREKMIVGADDHVLGPRNPANRTVEKLIFDVEECLGAFKTDYLDIWRVQAQMNPPLNTDPEVENMIEAAERLKKQGKIRFFGVSSHTRPWLKHIIEKYPQISMVIFPYTAQSKVIDGKEVIVERGAGPGGDDSQTSIFEAVKKCDVGVCTIKPFAGGSLFQDKTFPVLDQGAEEEHKLARLTLQYITTNDAITAALPGMTTPYEVENNVRASYERKETVAWQDVEWLKRKTDQAWANLPEDYAWLREWEWV
jgi:predicted aldo/keto reductase-like oxidoreductase